MTVWDALNIVARVSEYSGIREEGRSQVRATAGCERLELRDPEMMMPNGRLGVVQ